MTEKLSPFCSASCLFGEKDTLYVCEVCWHSRDIAFDQPKPAYLAGKQVSVIGTNNQRYYVVDSNDSVFSVDKSRVDLRAPKEKQRDFFQEVVEEIISYVKEKKYYILPSY